MHQIFAYLLCVLCLAATAHAEDVLPLAQGKFSFMYMEDGKTAPLPKGATVEFYVSKNDAAPRQLGLKGYVLGARNSVVFLEVSEKGAAGLVRWQKDHVIKVRKIGEPDLGEIADRRQAKKDALPFSIAPHMRRLAVTVDVSDATVKSWSPGESLIFPSAGATKRRVVRESGKLVRRDGPKDANGVFVLAKRLSETRFELTILTDPKDAIPLLQASIRGELSVRDLPDTPVTTTEVKRCFVTRRHGNDRMRVRIPCVD